MSTMSKREALRAERKRRETRQRLLWIGGIVALVLIFVALVVLPSLQPAGDFVRITPTPRPNAEGLSMGDPNAPVKVVEFSDFQCPGCKNFYENLEPVVLERYVKTGKVHFTYRPLAFIGLESTEAAKAAYCAAEQNRFWDYHDILFENHTGENVGDFSQRRLDAFAESLGLDTRAFQDCVNKNAYAQQLQENTTEANQAQVQYTPSFLVNGKLVLSDELLNAIELELAGIAP